MWRGFTISIEQRQEKAMAAFERVLWIALGALIAAIVGYFGGYFNERGKNYATKDDFDDLLEQQRQLTKATKQIEATISSEVWDRQRLLELKREALFPAIQALDRTKTAFVELWAARLVNLPPPFGDPKYEERKEKADERWLTEITRFDETRSNVSLVCGKTMRTALAEASQLIRTNASLIFKKKIDDGEFAAVGEKTREVIRKVNQLARAELGIVLPEEETLEDPLSRAKAGGE
jgi:hypothetical protein